MTDATSILVLSACTATKMPQGNDRAMLAEQLYAGQQHRLLMRGVEAYRGAGQPAGPLELMILSAGHGVIAANKSLRAYDTSFTGMRREQLRRHADRLGIPGAVSKLLGVRRRLAVLLLGDNYLRAAQLSSVAELGGPTLVLASPKSVARLPAMSGLHPVALDNHDARRFSCGLVALKGALAARLLTRLARNPSASIPVGRDEVLAWLEADFQLRSVRAVEQHFAEVA
jgi:hypothetical protein